MINISAIAFQVRHAMRPSGVDFPHTTALELIAAHLGYGTYAALKLDRDVDPDDMFPAADHVVMQLPALSKRMRKLGIDQEHKEAFGKTVVDACNLAVAGKGNPCRFHASMDEFQDFIFEDVQNRAFDDGEVSSAYAGTNAQIEEFYTDNYEYEPLVDAQGEWTLVASGSHTGEIDQDRPYSGHAGSFTATYNFQKEGRCGLIEIDLNFGLDFDRDYN